MKAIRYIFSVFVLLILAVPALADVWSTSHISTDTTWTKNNTSGDGVWVVDVSNDSLIIDKGATLTIEPGVTVKFHGDVLFMVHGAILAEGTVQDSIIFTSDDASGSAGEWSGIKILSDSTTENKLIYCRIEKGDADIVVASSGSLEENGGGIFCGAQTSNKTVISHCTIQHNKAYEGGGGIFVVGSPLIEYNLIRYNIAGQYGGGIGIRGGSLASFSGLVAHDNIIIHNKADGQGGGGIGIFANANASFHNDLIYDNSSLNGSGGGIFLYSSTSFVDMKNAIIYGNSANSDDQIFGVGNITYSDVQGGYSGEGNIDADPQFSDAANDDFHFEANAPVVDAGTNDGIATTDFDGSARPFDGDRDGTAVSDMGPYEYQNTPPEIVSEPVTTATEDQEYTYQVEASDPDAEEVLTYSLLEAPSFLSINPQTGLISGTATTDAQAGDYTVTVQVADLNQATDVQTYTLSVTAVNDAPVVSDIPDQTVQEGQTFATINLDEYVSDEESTPEEMAWSYSGNSQLQVSIDANHVATVTIPDTNWYGSETITFTATDPGGKSDGDSAVFTVTNVNDAPVVSDIPDQTIDEGQTFATIDLNAYVDDIDNDDSEIVWSYTGNSELIVQIDENNMATVSTPNADWNGSETITFKATDPGGLSDSNAATFTVNPVNDAPVVSDIPDQTIDEGESFVSIALDDYVSDVDNTDAEMTWTYSGNQDLQVIISADHIATISAPDSNWFGSETITFTATDPGGLSDSDPAVFTVRNVNDAPVANNDTTVTDEDVPVTIPVLSNDSDIDGDDLTVSEVTQPAHGNAEIDQNTQVIYTPAADWSGDDSFTYTISDGNGGTAQATVYVSVNAVNDAPVVSDIPDQTVQEGQTFAAIHLDDYVNDVDNPDSTLSWSYSGNSELQVSIDANHVATITIPDTNWNGQETITFTATDPQGLADSDAVVFTVTPVNDAPVAVNDSATTDEDTPVTLAVLENDSDSDGDALHIESVGEPLHGTASIENDTLLRYEPEENYFGTDSVRYVVSDGQGGSAQAWVFVTIRAVNDAPVVSDIPDQTVQEGQTFAAIHLDDYVNDVDNPDSTLSWSYSGNSELQVSIDANHVATITIPDTNWNGQETITFTATDPQGLADSDAVVFTVTPVNDAPVAVNDSATTDEDTPVTLAVLENDSDSDGDALHIESVGEPLHGTASIENDTLLRYEPEENYFGTDSVRYVVSDGQGGSAQAWVFVTIRAVNDAPVISSIPDQTVQEGQAFDDIALDAYVNDVDNSDSSLTWQYSGNEQLNVQITQDRILKVWPKDENWDGSETIVLTVNDPDGASDQDSVVFTVLPVNDAPFAVNDSLTLPEDSVATINVLQNDSDVENDTLVIQSFGKPQFGELTWQDSSFTYRPQVNYFGADSFYYVLSDGQGGLDTASVFIRVLPVDDAPVLSAIEDQVIEEGQEFPAIPLDNYVTDVDDPDSLLQWSFKGNDALQVQISAQRILFVNPPSEEWNGAEILTLTVRDTSGLLDSTNVKFEVLAVNDTAQIQTPLPTLTFKEDDSLCYAIRNWFPYVNDADDPDSVLIFDVSNGKNVKAVKRDTVFVFKAPDNFFGNDTLQLTVSDGQASNSAPLFVKVKAVNDAPEIYDLPAEISFTNDTSYVLVMKNYAHDIDTPDSLLSWNFLVSTDSLKFTYDVETTELKLTAPQFSGKAQLICILSDDSAATARDTISVSVSPATGLEDELLTQLPKAYELFQNFPNPFNPTTTIKFALPRADHVKIVVYNILGKKVATLVDANKPAGYHVVTFDGSRLASGIYFYQMQTKHFVRVKKFILLR